MDLADDINDLNASDKQNLTFEKMKARFDVIQELEKLGNLNDLSVLRKEIQRHAYLLATKLYENKRASFRIQQSQSFQIRLKNEIQLLKQTNKAINQSLEDQQTRMYDIDYDDYD